MSRGSHYSNAFDIRMMQTLCEKAATMLHEYSYNERCEILLMYTGLSGISTATVLAHTLYSKYRIIPHMICVRKEGDNNHNNSAVEVSDYHTERNKIAMFFVDDLIELGDTRERTMQFALMETRDMLKLRCYPTASHVGNVLIYDNVIVEYPDRLAILVE